MENLKEKEWNLVSEGYGCESQHFHFLSGRTLLLLVDIYRLQFSHLKRDLLGDFCEITAYEATSMRRTIEVVSIYTEMLFLSFWPLYQKETCAGGFLVAVKLWV